MKVLPGGRQNQIIQSGDVIVRPAGFWSPAVHLLLAHLHREGFSGAPQALGFDPQGNEILSFIPGEVGNDPLSPAAASDAALVSAARLLRDYHMAAAAFLEVHPVDLSWRLPRRDPAEVICHGDFAPYNVVLEGQEAVAIIDFDTAHPGPCLWDVAYAVYRWAPLFAPEHPGVWVDFANQVRRARLFCEAYGLSQDDRMRLVHEIIDRLHALVDFILAQAAQGDETFQAHMAEGHHHLYLADVDYLNQNRETITQGLL